MTHTLETLLVRIRDGAAVPGDAERAVELVRSDARLPEDLRKLRRVRGSDAAGLLAVLGADDLFPLLGEAIRAEAGDLPSVGFQLEAHVIVDDGWDEIVGALRLGLQAEARDIDVSEGVIRRLGASGFPWGAVLADAVEAEAGGVALADDVVEEPAFPVAEALFDEAGSVDLADAVMATLAGLDARVGIGAVPLAEAVRDEAGPVSVTTSVMAAIVQPVPRPANDPSFGRGASSEPRRRTAPWGMGLVALAAAALIGIVVGRLSLPLAGEESHPMLFAQAGDVVVEDLSYGVGVQVYQIEGEQGAVILWIDEGA